MMIKKLLALTFALLLSFSALAGCQKTADDGKLTIVCSVFPLYDWVKNLVGDAENTEVILLLANGTDPHSYQPSAEDIIRIASCDLIVYVGGESDRWIEEALERNAVEGRRELKLSETEGITSREVLAESLASDCEDGHCEEYDHGHEMGTVDDHIWLSLRNASTSCRAITEQLCQADEEQAPRFRENLATYEASLSALNAKYAALSAEHPNATLLFADRFPFVYLTEDYGMEYVAAFRGCTTEIDADFDTIVRLAKQVDERGLNYVLVTETSDRALAQSVIRATEGKDQEIAVMNSLQSVTEKEIAEGVTYLSVMESNLTVLRQVLANNR